MLRRICWWAIAGLAVALFWLAFILIVPRGQGPSADWPIVQISVPFLPFARHVPITWYQSLVLNAACYAFIGLIVETIRLTVRASVARLREL